MPWKKRRTEHQGTGMARLELRRRLRSLSRGLCPALRARQPPCRRQARRAVPQSLQRASPFATRRGAAHRLGAARDDGRDKILSARKARKSGAKRRPRREFSSLEIVQETSSVEHSGGGWLPGWFSRRERVKQQETKAGPSVDSTATLRSEAATQAEIETDRGVMVTGTLGYCR
jgi:hypothetical protein